MSCTSLSFSETHTIIGSGGISITITVPQVYSCTNIQIRFRSEAGIIEDWFDYAVLNQLVTTINFPFGAACYIDVRLSQCCPEPPPDPDDPEPPLPPGGGGGGGGDPEDPPCALIAISEDECGPEVSITNPYRKPSDASITEPYNDITIPKAVSLKITQSSCSDISALLCTVRCAPPGEPGICPCKFIPEVDIYSLPNLTIGRTPYGVPIDFDALCNLSGGIRARPKFYPPQYTKIKAFYQATYGFSAVPFIDGIGYDTTELNTSTWVFVHECDTDEQLRTWTEQHFRFFGISSDKTTIKRSWPYNDLYWTPYDFCIANNYFTPEDGVVYVNLIPC